MCTGDWYDQCVVKHQCGIQSELDYFDQKDLKSDFWLIDEPCLCCIRMTVQADNGGEMAVDVNPMERRLEPALQSAWTRQFCMETTKCTKSIKRGYEKDERVYYILSVYGFCSENIWETFGKL